MNESEQSLTKRTETAFDDFRDLWCRRKWLCLLLILIMSTPIIVSSVRLVIDFSIKKENERLRQQNSMIRQERDAKAAQLAPFLAVANKEFTDSPQAQRLDKLITMVEEFLSATETKLSRLPLPRQLTYEVATQMEKN